MVYYNRKNKLLSNYVFFHLHEYMEDEIGNDVLFKYMLFDVALYLSSGVMFHFWLNFNFWYSCFMLLPLMFIEHCFAFMYFYLYPKYRSKSKKIETIEKNIEKLASKKEYWDDKNSYESVFSYDDIRALTLYYKWCLECEQEYLRDVIAEKEFKKSNAEENATKKDNRIIQLENILNEINCFVNNENINSLVCIGDAINELLDTIKQKPIGIRLISNNLFVYFDELKYILEKYITLNDENKEKYNLTIAEIAERLTSNIKEICNSIEKLETDDIEVSMNVLLSELKNVKNLEISNTAAQLINVENDIMNEMEDKK